MLINNLVPSFSVMEDLDGDEDDSEDDTEVLGEHEARTTATTFGKYVVPSIFIASATFGVSIFASGNESQFALCACMAGVVASIVWCNYVSPNASQHHPKKHSAGLEKDEDKQRRRKEKQKEAKDKKYKRARRKAAKKQQFQSRNRFHKSKKVNNT